MIKHRELAKLRCNLAGDVLPSGLARRGPRAAPIYIYTHTHTYVSVWRTEAVRHRKVLGDIAPAIRPSFWELNFCGSRLSPGSHLARVLHTPLKPRTLLEPRSSSPLTFGLSMLLSRLPLLATAAPNPRLLSPTDRRTVHERRSRNSRGCRLSAWQHSSRRKKKSVAPRYRGRSESRPVRKPIGR